MDLSSGPWSSELSAGRVVRQGETRRSEQKTGAETATQTELAWQGLGKKGWGDSQKVF